MGVGVDGCSKCIKYILLGKWSFILCGVSCVWPEKAPLFCFSIIIISSLSFMFSVANEQEFNSHPCAASQ